MRHRGIVSGAAVRQRCGESTYKGLHRGMPEPLGDCRITDHARFEWARRGIDATTVRHALTAPEQRHQVRPGRDVPQSRLEIEDKTYLVRVFVDLDRSPPEVVTVYRTSKVSKYWRADR